MKGNFTLEEATETANKVVEVLSPHCNKIEICGSIRRKRPFVGDIDIIVAGPQEGFQKAISQFLTSTLLGYTKFSFELDGIQVDILIVEEATWGAALMHSTGDKTENIKLRALAKRKSRQLSQYGLKDFLGNLVAGKTEEEVYEALGTPFRIPEQRAD